MLATTAEYHCYPITSAYDYPSHISFGFATSHFCADNIIDTVSTSTVSC
jgi:hypothetical protein